MSLALALAAAGIEDVDVYESAPEIRELGVGINLMPHAVRELSELGLLAQLQQGGVETAEFFYFTRRGQEIWREPLGLAAGFRWPQISIHRGTLLGILHNAVVERLGADRVHVSRRFTRFGESGGGAWAEFAGGADGERPDRVRADLLVGCDGVHSAVRRALHPHEGPPRWNGVIMLRGVTRCPPFLSGRTMINVGSSRQRVVVYPITEAAASGGLAWINWVATWRLAAGGMPPQDWTRTAPASEVIERFGDFVFDFLDVPALARGADVIYRYPMVDRDPLDSWSRSAVTLLGDAAHPMHPVGGNGASQAVADARVLARALALESSIASAIAAYESERRPATAALVQSNRRAGPHRCQDLVEERAPGGFERLGDVVTRQELEEIASEYKRVAGFDVETLNNRPSRSVTV